MANQLSVLSSFTHITQEIQGIRAIVSVQYPELSSFQSLGDSFSKILGNKRAVYLAMTDQNLWHIHTVGEKVVKKVAIETQSIDDIQIAHTTLTGERDVKLPQVSITTKHITLKKVKEGKVKKTVEVPNFTQHDFTLFPVTFLANLKYNQKVDEVLQSVEMRQTVLSSLQKIKVKIADKKLMEQFNAQEK
jgi:hypothetical protein